MVPRTIPELEDLLIQLQLITVSDLSQLRSEVHGGLDVDGYLQLLERKQLLTTYQSGRVRKGETEGLVLGGCKLLYRNASGSFARVFRASRISDGQMLGMKVLRDRWANDPASIQLFRHEGQVGKRLKHPNIVPIYDVGSEGKFHFITMEFVEGGNLRDFMKIRKQLKPVEALRYALDIARGLEYALTQGITHRDMKTTNVLLSIQGVAKLIDFGLAADDSFFNRPGSPDLAQAIEYSTLERGTNAPANDPRSDLFFLGTILYELLSGEPPYPRTRDLEERRRFNRYRDIRPLAGMMPSLEWDIVSVVDRLIQINPGQRYQSPTELAEDLERLLEQLGHTPTQAVKAPVQEASSSTKTILCVENRPKRQDVLREYFSKHGFRLLLMGDVDRALNRIQKDPPQGIIFFGDVVGDRVVDDFKQCIKSTAGQDLVAVLVLSGSQSSLQNGLAEIDNRGKVLTQPIRLRDLRNAIQDPVESTT
ncbi:serine/threonine-protein kinase [Thalassoglobus sp. JC818]|uniref:serine/threonine protein kinase n=1 Tax=Thalassoglobus sp. JC818 TaxID=3232136 RepID=UPI00345A5604